MSIPLLRVNKVWVPLLVLLLNLREGLEGAFGVFTQVFSLNKKKRQGQVFVWNCVLKYGKILCFKIIKSARFKARKASCLNKLFVFAPRIFTRT